MDVFEPNKRELSKLRKRRDRLSNMALSVEKATWSMRTVAGTGMPAVYVRTEFVHTGRSGVPLPGDPSDRRLPNKAAS